MTDESQTADVDEANAELQRQATMANAIVVDGVRRADESLLMLASVQIANTQAARGALRDARLTVLERLLDDVRQAVGVEAPVPPGQMQLGG
jgi:hypothetical protein